MKRVTFIVALVILSFAVRGFAADKEAAPQQTPAAQVSEGQGQEATVVAVTMPASYQNLAEKDAKWTKLKVGDKLGGLCVVRTGLGGNVELEFADRGRWVVKSSTKFGIQEYAKQDDHVQVRLGLKYGYIKGDIDSSKGTNDFRVKTPVATLAATGTGGNFGYTSDRGLGALGTSGSWNMGTVQGSRNITTGQRTDGNRTLSSSILLRMLAAGLSPQGQTGIEQIMVDTNSGGRGLIALDNGGTRLIAPPVIPPCPRRVPIPSPNIEHSISKTITGDYSAP